MIPTPFPKQTATVTIEPLGPRSPRSGALRDHSIKVAIGLGAGEGEGKVPDTTRASRAARASLASFPPARGEPDGRKYVDVSTARKSSRTGPVISVVVGVEGSLIWPSRPEEDSVDDACAALTGEGYRVVVREKRECAEPGCKMAAVVDWNHAAASQHVWYCHCHTIRQYRDRSRSINHIRHWRTADHWRLARSRIGRKDVSRRRSTWPKCDIGTRDIGSRVGKVGHRDRTHLHRLRRLSVERGGEMMKQTRLNE